jgi:glucan biosynthesis protein C
MNNETRGGTESTAPARLFFLDNARSFLIMLVVAHHVALVYGASLEGYYYVEPPFTDLLAYLALLVFVLVNQSWFMGAFFLLAGYFTPGSYDRKGAGSFLKDRLLRLGIPLAVFFFLLSPVSFLGYYLMPAELTGIQGPLTWRGFWDAYPAFVGLGPLWFVAMLLIFSAGYACWRALAGRRGESVPGEPAPVPLWGIGLFVAGLAAVSWLFRIIVPIGKSVWQFPTLAYLPQYLGFFILGTAAYRRDWIRTLPAALGALGLLAAAAAGVLLFPLAVSGRMFSLEISPALGNAFGGGHWRSAVYALWDSIDAVGICLGLLVLFRALFRGPGRLGAFLARHGYAVYILHIPIVVFVAYALRGLALPALPKFAVAFLIVLPVCWLAAYLVRKLPLAERVV